MTVAMELLAACCFCFPFCISVWKLYSVCSSRYFFETDYLNYCNLVRRWHFVS